MNKQRTTADYELEMGKEMVKTMKMARRWPLILLGAVGLMVLTMFLYLRSFLV